MGQMKKRCNRKGSATKTANEAANCPPILMLPGHKGTDRLLAMLRIQIHEGHRVQKVKESPSSNFSRLVLDNAKTEFYSCGVCMKTIDSDVVDVMRSPEDHKCSPLVLPGPVAKNKGLKWVANEKMTYLSPVMDGCLFVKNRGLAKTGIQQWRCKNAGCTARISTKSCELVHLISQHNHPVLVGKSDAQKADAVENFEEKKLKISNGSCKLTVGLSSPEAAASEAGSSSGANDVDTKEDVSDPQNVELKREVETLKSDMNYLKNMFHNLPKEMLAKFMTPKENMVNCVMDSVTTRKRSRAQSLLTPLSKGALKKLKLDETV